MTDESMTPFSTFGPNAGLAREMYQAYLVDRSLVSDTWATYFDSISPNHLEQPSLKVNGHGTISTILASSESLETQRKVSDLISSYRLRGHLLSNLSPIKSSYIPRPEAKDLEISLLGFTEAELAQEFHCSGLAGQEKMQLSKIIEVLRHAYCETLGAEFAHLHKLEERIWMQEKIESRWIKGEALSANRWWTRFGFRFVAACSVSFRANDCNARCGD